MVRFVLTLGLGVFFFTIFSQNNNGTFYTNYTTDQGLPSTETYAVVQDKEGYLWFATDNGVCRFNGFEFKQFGPLQGLEDPVVFYIEVAEDGKVWFCSMSGKLFYYEKGAIFPYKHNKTISEFRKNSSFPNSFHIKKNTIYIGLRTLGILKINEGGNYQVIRKDAQRGAVFLEVGSSILSTSFQNAAFDKSIESIFIQKNEQEFYIEKPISKKSGIFIAKWLFMLYF
jgi:ligand-binding sensor domain-containing protein